tara:strand:- start:554 stop:943 length:390 start_codon:yes stop_codon:yes gene_type:complete
MKKNLIIFASIIFIMSSSADAAWFKLFSTQTADLFLDTKSIIRIDERITFSQLVNYKSKQKNGMLSLKTTSEIDCKNLKIRDNEYFAFKQKMGAGENFYKRKPKKNWKSSKKGTSVYFLNQVLCDRVLK